MRLSYLVKIQPVRLLKIQPARTPLEGLAPLIVQDLLGIIGRMVGSGDVGVILVEQHAHQILPMTRQALVLERGRVVYSGESRELRKDRERLDRWLGVGGH